MHIHLENLGKRYNSVTALNAVSLEIPAGSIAAVIGLNGAGKSTLLRSMAGIIAPSTGTIAYDGAGFSRANTTLRRRMFWMPDFPLIQAGTNLIQHIAMMVRAYGIDASAELETKIIEWRYDGVRVAVVCRMDVGLRRSNGIRLPAAVEGSGITRASIHAADGRPGHPPPPFERILAECAHECLGLAVLFRGVFSNSLAESQSSGRGGEAACAGF